MKHELTETQITSYREKGFLLIDDFLGQDEIKVWRCAVDEAIEQRAGRRLPYDKHGTVTAGNEHVFTQRVNLWMSHSGVRELMLDARIGKMATQLEGVDGIRIWHDQALVKGAWGDPTAWHQDNTKWSFSSEHAITIWIALDQVTLQNGCMFFLPGTHRRRLEQDFPTAVNVGTLFKTFPELADIEPTPAVLPAGGCSFHNGLMVHAAHANMSPRSRRAMTCAFMPDGSTYNGRRNVLPEEIAASLKIGDVLDNNEQNPLIYHS